MFVLLKNLPALSSVAYVCAFVSCVCVCARVPESECVSVCVCLGGIEHNEYGKAVGRDN